MRNDPTVSIIIPTYNRGPFIEHAIRSIVAQAYPADKFELIVVDDGSTDSTGEILERSQKTNPCMRVLHQCNQGPATARNVGIQESRGEIIVFMDDDCVADKRWVSELTRPYISPCVGGVAGRIRYVPPNANVANRIAAHNVGVGQPVDDRGRIPFFVTANASFRRVALEQVGGFDTAFPHAAQEDIDLSYRVRDAGWELAYADSALVDHFHNHTMVGDMQRCYQVGQAQITLYRKHGMPYTVWSDLPANLWAFGRIPFGWARNFAGGRGDMVTNLLGPVLYRLNRAMLALGRTKAYLAHRPRLPEAQPGDTRADPKMGIAHQVEDGGGAKAITQLRP
jgi:glycosyltransferase involved in cell wall biosynthesis